MKRKGLGLLSRLFALNSASGGFAPCEIKNVVRRIRIVNLGIATDSSQKLVDFLEKTRLHKKDFAEMIGVTLSYVYSLIDSKISFSKRITTLERIAVVMGGATYRWVWWNHAY